MPRQLLSLLSRFRRPSRWRRALAVLACGGLAALALIAFAHFRVDAYRPAVHRDVSAAPANPVGLLLGTSKTVFGRPNLFFRTRVAAAAELFHAGKVRALLVSGDHSRDDYNEPQDMKDALVAAGVPAEAVFLDYAGFSTLDSVVRAKEVFGLDRFTVISQPFHCERALYIAAAHGIEAAGFAAADLGGVVAKKTYLREYLARVKALLQVELLDSGPRFLGADPYGLGLVTGGGDGR